MSWRKAALAGLFELLAEIQDRFGGIRGLVAVEQRLALVEIPAILPAIVPREGLDLDALELACYSLQLPQRGSRTFPSGKPQRGTLRERAYVGDHNEYLADVNDHVRLRVIAPAGQSWPVA